MDGTVEMQIREGACAASGGMDASALAALASLAECRARALALEKDADQLRAQLAGAMPPAALDEVAATIGGAAEEVDRLRARVMAELVPRARLDKATADAAAARAEVEALRGRLGEAARDGLRQV